MTMTRGLHSIHSEQRPTDAQRHWLERGARQPGGKLPLFDEWGQRGHEGVVRSCIAHGWAAPRVHHLAHAGLAALHAHRPGAAVGGSALSRSLLILSSRPSVARAGTHTL